ncbi:uracil-DNA glycosylase family protein [Sphingorhabdus arenilitoris]|uniref:Uracil-DNA glycosylase family protein n=1 Tax=Sphingorhabdus arenilitoris TaxID=1490041 RepID=A0ABV8RFG4_9SPHN
MSLNSTLAVKTASAVTKWWEMAGLGYLVEDEPVNWLEAEKPKEAPIAPPKTQTHARPNISDIPKTAPAAPVDPASWPQSVEQLLADIENGAPLPGNQFGGNRAKPVGAANCELMIISDLPDFDEIEAGFLGAGESGKLLANVTAAIGQGINRCFLTALASTRPASGDLPEEEIPQLTAFMMHQIGLVKPKTLLILGSAACSALLGAELMSARGSLLFVKHNGQKVSAVTTFHPRTLMARPVLKAQAWRDLQMLLINKDLM